ncbi:hypothetical protein A8C56_17155 [Niabella ginsenosidivorans]|uniref:Uncharacterized protein n=1 Tax=Niabella ginsenosidivorans TaxID=1176587 RepID=A0A1A9I4C1_9BACT|nr:hypothetical protein [Niabella ginsenosidivorans]ANH82466.1 hypothetical protein A8C56_17155 [Niabella ginsenosidivorans]
MNKANTQVLPARHADNRIRLKFCPKAAEELFHRNRFGNNGHPVFSFGSSIPSGHWQHLLNDSFNIAALRAFLRLWLFAATDIWLLCSRAFR